MTVPGKGGRPRKWRSDADRVRAFRARQRGEEEPTNFESALVDGDELAQAIERVRQLQAELVDAIESLAEAEVALQTERRRHQATQRKLDRARADLDGRIASDARPAEEVRVAQRAVESLTVENRDLRAQIARSVPATGPNRTARRQAAKRNRRTER